MLRLTMYMFYNKHLNLCIFLYTLQKYNRVYHIQKYSLMMYCKSCFVIPSLIILNLWGIFIVKKYLKSKIKYNEG